MKDEDWFGVDRRGSVWRGSARLGSARLGSPRLGSARFVERFVVAADEALLLATQARLAAALADDAAPSVQRDVRSGTALLASRTPPHRQIEL